MADMASSEVIRKIGDTLTDLDMLAASPGLSDTDFRKVRQSRRALDRQQLLLVQAEFRESTKRFQTAAVAVKQANDDVQKTIDDVSKVGQTLAAVSTLVTAASSLLSIAIP